MFEDRMKTSAIPERVYALCQAIKSRTMQESDLRELLEPSNLGGSTKYFGTVRDAAKQLGLIGLSTLFQTNFFRLFFRYCTGV